MPRSWQDRLTGWPGWEIAALGVATLVGIWLRFWGLGVVALSQDEIFSWDFSHQSLGFLFGRLAHIEPNPPFYYLLLHVVMRLGESEYLLRAPSAVAGSLAIPLLYVIGRLGSARAGGLIGAALLALNAPAIAFSREARAYAMELDAGLLAAIGAVIVVTCYAGRGAGSPGSARRENAGWALLTLGSILGFYLHYTFLFVIFALHCALALAAVAERRPLARSFVVKWLLSFLVLFAAISWGLILAVEQRNSAAIFWIHRPSLLQAVGLVVHVGGYGGIGHFQPWLSLIVIGAAGVGLLGGWRRSAAVLVCGVMLILFPTVLFLVSQLRPILLDRTLLPAVFAVCLLAGQGSLLLAAALSTSAERMLGGRGSDAQRFPFAQAKRCGLAALLLVLFLPAAISAGKVVGREAAAQPFDKVAAYLPGVMKPGDAAAGVEGVIYYRRREKLFFPYFRLAISNPALAQVSAASQVACCGQAVLVDQASRFASRNHAIYIVLYAGPEAIMDARIYPSVAAYIRDRLGIRGPPLATFGSLVVYRLAGTCPEIAPCLADAAPARPDN